MRSRGWNGSPPRDDEQARERIIDAARRCIERYGPTKTGLSDVATELGVTRQTVYRHFATTDELLNAAAVADASAFLDKVAGHVAACTDTVGVTDVVGATVEMVAYTLESLAEEWFITQSLTHGAVSPLAVDYGVSLLHRLPVDWTALEYTPAQLHSLAELLLRITISFLHSPSDPPRTPRELRATLRRWLSPLLAGVGSHVEALSDYRVKPASERQ